MRTQHTRIQSLLLDVLNATDCENPAVLQTAWLELESEFLQHLELEETHMFPHVERLLPATVARLRQEHREMRDQFCRLGVCADLHALRRATVVELIRTLHRHFACEEMTLYPASRVC